MKKIKDDLTETTTPRVRELLMKALAADEQVLSLARNEVARQMAEVERLEKRVKHTQAVLDALAILKEDHP